MALVVADRIKETTSTTGTGTYTLAGASTGFEAFSVIGDGNTTYYCCTDGTDFEVGIGTYTASGTTLARTTILQSSNSDSAVNWGSGTRDIFVTQPAEKAVFLNASDNIELADNEKIILGTGSDLEISHTGTNSLIVDNGTGNLFLQSNGNGIFLTTPAAAENMLRALKDGAVELYHDNSKKLETTSSGATVTGTAKATVKFETDDVTVGFTSNGATSGSGNFGVASSNGGARINADSGSNSSTFIDFDATNISASGGDITYRFGRGTTEGSSDLSELIFYAHDGTNNPVIRLRSTGELIASSLDISGDVDVDGTLEADAMTLNGTAITSTATLSTGISNNNVPKFTSGVADNDFLRVDGTSIEGRSASEVLSDIGGQASLTFGISNTNAVKIDSTSVADDEYARFTANGLESRSTSEVLSDIGGITASSTDTLTNKTLTTPVINGFSGTGDGSLTGDLTLTSTDAGATGNPTLEIYRNSASPAANDIMGEVVFSGENSAGEKVTYSRITSQPSSVTDGSESDRLQLRAIRNGTEITYLECKFDFITLNKPLFFNTGQNIVFEGSTSDNNELTLTPADVTADRTITLPDATGTVLLADGDGSSLTNVNATTLDSVDSTSFLRSDAADTKTSGDLTFSDSVKAVFGTGSDLQIYHNGTHSYIQDAGTGDLVLLTNQIAIRNAAQNADIIRGIEGGAVTLSHNGSSKIATTSDGATVTGDLTLTSTANDGGVLKLVSDDPADATDFGTEGQIQFFAENSASQSTQYYSLQMRTADITDGTEDGWLYLNSIADGTLNTANAFGSDGTFYLLGNGNAPNAVIKWFQTKGTSHNVSLAVSTPSASRTITLPDASGTVQLTDGSGASLTSLNASQLSSGTVPNARLDAQLQDVAGLAVTNGGFIVGDGSNFVLETGSTARASLELGTAAVLDTGISNTNIPKFTSGVADNDFLRVDGTAIEGRSASEVLSDIGAITASSTDTLTNKTLTTPVINGFSGTGNGTITGDLTVTSTDGGSTDDPTLLLYRNSASPATSDEIGHIIFRGNNSSSGQTADYASITTKIMGSTNNLEHGELNINVLRTGSNLEVASFNYFEVRFKEPVKLDEDVNITFEGSSSNSHETVLDVVDPTADRTINLPDASGTVLTTGNSDTPTTTTSSSDADFVLVDDGGTMKKITPANLGISSNQDYGLITSSTASSQDYGAIT